MGLTLGRAPGFLHWRATIRRTSRAWLAAAAIVTLALVIAISGLVVSQVGEPRLGVVADQPGGVVVSVFPGAAADRDGIRVGQAVAQLTDQPLVDWALETTDGKVGYATSQAAHLSELRDGVWFGALGLLLCLAAVMLLGSATGVAVALAALGGALAAEPLWTAGGPILSSVGAIVALGLSVAAVGYFARARRPVVLSLAGACGALVTAWLVARYVAPSLFQPFEAMRAGTSAAASAASLAIGVRLYEWRLDEQRLPPHAIDVAVLAGALAGLLLLWGLGDAPISIVSAMAVIGILAYPRLRRRITSVVDSVVFVEVLERSRAGAIEEERARLARELHDDPLQELVAVITQLRADPTSALLADSLARVAQRLRALATDDGVAVLDDLGLTPALTVFLTDPERGALVRLELDDRTGYSRDRRLPREVEVAAYRIINEAVQNARRHAVAQTIGVVGTITPTRLELFVVDDGHGMDRQAVGLAQASGHLGLRTMRQRARSIDASLDFTSSAGGTTVRLEWSA